MITRALAIWMLCAGLASAQVPKPNDIALTNARFILWHQATAALADQHGRRPDAWTAAVFALSRVADGESAQDIERLLWLAETWLMAESEGRLPRHLSEAGIDGELARRVLCYVAGEGPGRAHDLVGRWGAPRGSIDCAAAMAEDFEQAERTFRDLPSGEGTAIQVRYGDGEWSTLAAEHEILEEMADILSADFDWPTGLKIEILPCGGFYAWYRPQDSTITLCAELIAYYHRLADGRIGY